MERYLINHDDLVMTIWSTEECWKGASARTVERTNAINSVNASCVMRPMLISRLISIMTTRASSISPVALAAAPLAATSTENAAMPPGRTSACAALRRQSCICNDCES